MCVCVCVLAFLLLIVDEIGCVWDSLWFVYACPCLYMSIRVLNLTAFHLGFIHNVLQSLHNICFSSWNYNSESFFNFSRRLVKLWWDGVSDCFKLLCYWETGIVEFSSCCLVSDKIYWLQLELELCVLMVLEKSEAQQQPRSWCLSHFDQFP